MFKAIFKTNRLLIKPLHINDSDFMFELANSDTWLRFIGDKKIYSHADAVH
ncbi:MAG: hypothetical protein GW809_07455 [Bacteroidetes bacterium]|nr:hypothetical protein [Bacteroidota bacterium]